MKQSQLFTKTSKNISSDEVSRNAQLLVQAGFVDKLMAGVHTLLPMGLKVVKKIEQIIREEMNKMGGQEIIMPALHPKENWDKTGRWDTMDDLFQLKMDNDKQFALGPTHEEVVSPLAKRFISSYKDLPKAVYQFQHKFRNEKRAKSGLLRGREFFMKDMYSFNLNQEELDGFYEKAIDAYQTIFKRCGLNDLTYLTYASGGSFSKYSHEFQTLTQAGEDIIYICDDCKAAINKEIIEDLGNKCPECGNGSLREEKAIEVGNIFKLGTKYSEPFSLAYKDQDGQDKPVIMGCYGIGLERLMGTVVEVSNDERGIIWPESIAPYRVHLLALGVKKEIFDKADEIYNELSSAGIEVLLDDRSDVSAGEKMADADLMGITYRVIISEKTLAQDSVEIKKRNESEARLEKIPALLNYFKY